MKRTWKLLFLISLSLLLISLQSSLFSFKNLGSWSPDLNLILITYLALYSQTQGEFALALGNGVAMDALSGLPLGLHTFSRASAFLIARGFSESIYIKTLLTFAALIFLSTIYAWSFVWVVLIITGRHYSQLSFSTEITQAVANTAFGLPLFWLIGRIDARL